MNRDEAWVEAALALAEAATPGPWVLKPLNGKEQRFDVVGKGAKVAKTYTRFNGSVPGDPVFIAASRTDVPRLCRELLASWAETKRLRGALKRVANWADDVLFPDDPEYSPGKCLFCVDGDEETVSHHSDDCPYLEMTAALAETEPAP